MTDKHINMLKFINSQGNANQNHKKILFYMNHMSKNLSLTVSSFADDKFLVNAIFLKKNLYSTEVQDDPI